MITGLHAMFYTPKADEMRDFLRDKLGLTHTDVGDGWLIFKPQVSEIGCHPAEKSYHEMSFYCDDITQTIADLEAKGVEFTHGVTDAGFGKITKFKMPDGSEAELYEPKYKA